MNIFRKIATVILTETVEKKIMIVPPAGVAAFVGENGSIPEIGFDVLSHQVKSHKIAKISKVATELVNDKAFDLEGALAGDFGRTFGMVEEDGCINGNGIDHPFGILHPTEGAETGVTASGTLAMGFDELLKLFFSLKAEYRRTASWVVSDETALFLRTLKDAYGNHIWRHTDDTLWGRPVYTSPYMPEIASGAKPVMFGDFRFYWLIERGGIALKPLREKYAAFGVTGFMSTQFIDGRLVRREAVKVLEIA
jgi:HK97 family phage major capsid protein